MNKEDKENVEDFNELLESYDNSDIGLMLRDLKKYAESGHFKRDYNPQDIEDSNYISGLTSKPDNSVDVILSGLKYSLNTTDYNTVVGFVAYTVNTKNLPSAKRHAKKGNIHETHKLLLSIEHHAHNTGDPVYKQLVQETKNSAYNTKSDIHLNEAENVAGKVDNFFDINEVIEEIKKSVEVQNMAIPPLDKSDKSQEIVGNAFSRVVANNINATIAEADKYNNKLAKTGKHSSLDEEAQNKLDEYKKAVKIISEGGSIGASPSPEKGFWEKLGF